MHRPKEERNRATLEIGTPRVDRSAISRKEESFAGGERGQRITGVCNSKGATIWKPEAAYSTQTARWRRCLPTPPLVATITSTARRPFVGANEPTSELLRIVRGTAEWTRERGERDCPTVNVCFTRLLRDYVRRGASDGAAKSRRQTIHSYLRLFEHVRTWEDPRRRYFHTLVCPRFD